MYISDIIITKVHNTVHGAHCTIFINDNVTLVITTCWVLHSGLNFNLIQLNPGAMG